MLGKGIVSEPALHQRSQYGIYYKPGGGGDKESSWSYGFKRRVGETAAETTEGFFSWFFKHVPAFLLIGGLIFFVMNATSPELRASTLEKGRIAAEKMHIPEGFSKVKDYLNIQKALEAATGIGDFEKRPDYLIEGVSGVDVERFDGTNVYEGDPFQLQAELIVDAFPNEDSKLKFSCQLRDKSDIIQLDCTCLLRPIIDQGVDN